MTKMGKLNTYPLQADRKLIDDFKLACYKNNKPMSDVLRNYMTEYSGNQSHGNQSHRPLEFTSDLSQVQP
jgi:hypothetical protein